MTFGLGVGIGLGARKAGGVAPMVITNANWLSDGDSIAIDSPNSGIGAISRTGLTATGTLTITNQSIGGTLASAKLTRAANGEYNIYWAADRRCVFEIQAGTNDYGISVSGVDVYNTNAALSRLMRALGWYTYVREVLDRSDATWNGTKNTERLAGNTLTRNNADGAFDAVMLTNGDATIGDASGIGADVVRMPDLLHPTPAVHQYIGTGPLKNVILPLSVGAPRANRTVTPAFESGAAYGLGRFGWGMTSGGTFINTPPWPVDNTVRPITFEGWFKPLTTTAQGILGKLDNPGGTPQFLVGIDGAGKYYMNIANGASVVATTVSAVAGTWVYLRFIMLAGNTKLEVDSASQVTSATAVPTGGTRAIRYQTLDAAHGVADFAGTVSGVAIWDGDRSGVANPTAHLPTNTANLRAYYPLERHVLGWN